MSSTTFNRAAADYISTAGGSVPTNDVPVSMFAWFRPDTSMSADDYCIMQLEDRSAADNYLRLGVINDNIIMVTRNPGGFTNIVGTTTVSTSAWSTGLAVGRADNDWEVYLNGASEASSSVNRAPDGNIDGLTIGRERDSTADDSWSGQIAHVAVWGSDVSAYAAELHAGAHPFLIDAANLLFYADLEDAPIDWIGGLPLTASGTARSAEDPIISRPWSDEIILPAAAPAGGRIMGSLAGIGGLAGHGGIAGPGGGL